ncbi:L-type lectin-domain containing receptor kinase SIT2-like [Triticum dicoccoides]|uniref:L-type lectin-domain containing receptor kinase SIT2-like n=1 Tax=Triticum dicoccoides TaxID=85692 RepID=UPI00188E964B|nr:L-type lectin-domain containing receptor kinase SIT2-like [Triticum dicoccoides]
MQSMLALGLLLLLSIHAEMALAAEDGQFAYQGFATANLTLDGLAGVTPNGLLLLTNTETLGKGHAFHPAPLRFLQTSTSSTAMARSFSTSFVFAITSNYDGLTSYGIAFVVAPTLNHSASSGEQYLGLLNTINGTASDPILAVELDTIMNVELHDIDSNHLGIDVNSLISRQASPSGYYNNENGAFQELRLNSRRPMQVWVDYDAQSSRLNVTLAPVQVPKPRNPLLSEVIDLSTVMADTMYIGFSASRGYGLGMRHYVLGWSFSMDGATPLLDISKLPTLPCMGPQSRSKMLDVVLPLVAALLVIAVLAMIFFFFLWRRRQFTKVQEDWEDEFSPHRFAYKDIFYATEGFSSRNLLGVGGFGRVYKGVLSASNLEVAVKRVSHDSKQGLREFIAEVVSIGRLRHRNLAQLLGYCHRKGELLLVYDYMENGSLDKYLYNGNKPTLQWSERYRIIKGVASGLLYLHEEWDQTVIHRDIKASNVLLDNQLNGWLGDFGLARLYDHVTVAKTTHVVGTMGYLAPEVIRTGKATPLTDVFSFGVFLLEVACGRRPISISKDVTQIVLVNWVLERHRKGSILDAVDPRLMGNFNIEEVTLVLKLGLLCSYPSSSARPSMRKIVQYLDHGQSVPDLSPTYMSYNTLAMM